MTYPRLNPHTMTPGQYKCRLIYYHNGCRGSASMMRGQLQDIMDLPTATTASKALAKQMLELSLHLQESLKTRDDSIFINPHGEDPYAM